MRWFVLICCLSLLVGCSRTTGAGTSKATRVSVKHATDPDANKIRRTNRKISIEELLAMRMPDGSNDLESFQDSRVEPFETSTYEIDGTIKSIVHRKDGDFYMVVEDDKGHQAVVEVPDPEQCEGSPLQGDIEKTRKTLDDRYHPTDEPKDVNEKATLDGVGFMGWKGSPGSGANASKPRLMPGTGVRFK